MFMISGSLQTTVIVRVKSRRIHRIYALELSAKAKLVSDHVGSFYCLKDFWRNDDRSGGRVLAIAHESL